MSDQILDHEHELVSPTEFVFEDVLVSAVVSCGAAPANGPSCDASVTVQHEVQFDSVFDRDAMRTLPEDEAMAVWDEVCRKYGVVEISRERHMSGGVVGYEDRSGNEFEVTFDNSEETPVIESVEVEIDGTKYELDVEYYRKANQNT